MAEIHPFRALHYNPSRIQELWRVVTQPYDKISPEMQSRYYRCSPFNLVRVIRGQHHADDKQYAGGPVEQALSHGSLPSDYT
jgi:uncharacterized protein (DUF1015 family)